MINAILIGKDMTYGRMLTSLLSIRNSNFRLCGIAKTNSEILFLINSIKVDVIIIDLEEKNIIKILKLIYQYTSHCFIILTIDNEIGLINKDILLNTKVKYNIKSNNIMDDVNSINSFLILKSVMQYSDVINERKIRKKIEKELNYLGYNPSHRGTKYITETIYLLYTSKEYLDDNLERDIYPIIAKKFGKTVSNIKVNIKNATEIMYYESEEEKLKEYLRVCYLSKPKAKRMILAILSKI